MNASILGLSISYLIVITLLLLVVLRTDLHWISKAIAIFISCWFAMAMAYTPPNFMGWARQEKFELIENPDGSIEFDTTLPEWAIHSFIIQEPAQNSAGGISFLMIPFGATLEDGKKIPLLPKDMFSYHGEIKDARLFKVPYSRKLHKLLLKKNKKKGGKKGGMLILKKGLKKTKGRKSSGEHQPRNDKAQFKIINPYELLKKE